MNLKILALGALLISQMAWAGNDTPVMPTPAVNASWSYRILGFVFKGLEETLRKSGLQFEVCSYQSLVDGKVINAKGMGECLFVNFKEGLSNKGDVGGVYLWVKSQRSPVPLPIRVDWRPTEEGLFKIIQEVLTLKLEPLAHWWSEHVSKNSAEEKPLKYAQNILGRLRLTFPANTVLADFITSEKQNELLENIEMAKQLEFEMKPLYKKSGYANYQGVLSVSQEVSSPDEQGTWSLDFVTNLNFLKTSRPFDVKGKFDGGLEEISE